MTLFRSPQDLDAIRAAAVWKALKQRAACEDNAYVLVQLKALRESECKSAADVVRMRRPTR